MDPHTLKPWIDDMLLDSCADVRSTALRCCLRLESSHYKQEAVLACCADDVPEVRAAALAVWPSLNAGEDKLYEALADPDALVVAQAVISCVFHNNWPSIPEMIDHLFRVKADQLI